MRPHEAHAETLRRAHLGRSLGTTPALNPPHRPHLANTVPRLTRKRVPHVVTS